MACSATFRSIVLKALVYSARSDDDFGIPVVCKPLQSVDANGMELPASIYLLNIINTYLWVSIISAHFTLQKLFAAR